MADELLDRIIAGEFPPGSSVPGELELSARHEVSRMTVREAMKTLEAQQILSVERGRGTFVNPLSRWASLEAVLRAASEGKNDAAAAVQLIELRRMLESGACELAAGRISDADLKTLYGQLESMRAAHEKHDVAAFVAADLAFHDLILRAAENVFVAVLFAPLHRVLESGGPRRQRCARSRRTRSAITRKSRMRWPRVIRTGRGTPWTPTCNRRWMTSRPLSWRTDRPDRRPDRPADGRRRTAPGRLRRWRARSGLSRSSGEREEELLEFGPVQAGVLLLHALLQARGDDRESGPVQGA